MAQTDIMTSSGTGSGEARATPEAPVARCACGVRATIGLALAVVALSLPLYPSIKQGIESLAGPQQWLPERLYEASGSSQVPAAVTASGSASRPEAGVEVRLTAVETSLAELQSAVAQSDATTRIDSVQQSLAIAQERLSTLDTRLAASEATTSTKIEQLDKRLSEKLAPEVTSLLTARLALLSAVGGLKPDDLDAITAAAAADLHLAEAVARLTVLVEQEVPPLSLLRERFPGLARVALAQATERRMGWWDSSIHSIKSTLSDLGFGRGAEATRDSVVIAETARQLDLGRLPQAMFELDSASAELKSLLSGWINDARQRIALDAALLQLVDLMLTRASASAAKQD